MAKIAAFGHCPLGTALWSRKVLSVPQRIDIALARGRDELQLKLETKVSRTPASPPPEVTREVA
jgi:hypothetical protein